MGMILHPDSITGRPTELGKYYLLYRCASCGSEGLSEQTLERANRRSFVKEQEKANPELYGGKAAGKPSAQERDAAFQALKRRLEEGDWSPIEKKVCCGRCKAVQPWSGMGKPWPRTLLAVLTAAGILFTVIELRLRLGDPTGRSGDPVLALVPAGVMLLLSLGYILGRRKRLADQRRSTAEKPEFYGPGDLKRLREGPYGHLLKPYTENR